MTIAELIERLKVFDQDLPVYLDCSDAYYSGWLTDADLVVKNFVSAPGTPCRGRLMRFNSVYDLEDETPENAIEKKPVLAIWVE